MISDEAKRRVEAATVHFPASEGTGGRGFLVAGGFILTAAHCIQFETTGAMVLGDSYFEHIVARDGTKLVIDASAVEPVADVAALCAVDGQEHSDEAEAFEAWCERTQPLQLSRRTFASPRLSVDGDGAISDVVHDSERVYILAHTGEWITGTATRFGATASIAIETDAPVIGGTSGSAVLDLQGDVIGVVSNATVGEDDGGSNGTLPVLRLALPAWVIAAIDEGSAA